MSNEDEQKRDEVLKRLLETPPKPHRPLKDKDNKDNGGGRRQDTKKSED